MSRYHWHREKNDESPRCDVRSESGDIVCVIWDEDELFTVQGWDAVYEQCDESDGIVFPTWEEAKAEAERRVAASDVRWDA